MDGDNPTLTSGVVSNSADLDACEAIGAYEGLSNTSITNNIVKNIYYTGIDFYNEYNFGASTSGNTISNNKFDNISPAGPYGLAVLIYKNCYTDITDNVMTRVRVGVQTGNFFSGDAGTSHDITDNTIESARIGVWHNLAYSSASTFNISDKYYYYLSGRYQ